MKRLLLILALVLLLAGCAPKTEVFPQATEPTEETTEPVSLYIANSSVEQQTGGAVKVYVPEAGEYIGMATMAGKVVLVSDLSELTLIDAENGKQILLGKFRQNTPPGTIGEIRCDLHPRWNPAGDIVTLDSIDSGRRAIYLLDLHEAFSELASR